MHNRQSHSESKTGFKEACQRSPATDKKDQYRDYLDKMQEDLNTNIRDNIFPHWRGHNSLKGTTS